MTFTTIAIFLLGRGTSLLRTRIRSDDIIILLPIKYNYNSCRFPDKRLRRSAVQLHDITVCRQNYKFRPQETCNTKKEMQAQSADKITNSGHKRHAIQKRRCTDTCATVNKNQTEIPSSPAIFAATKLSAMSLRWTISRAPRRAKNVAL